MIVETIERVTDFSSISDEELICRKVVNKGVVVAAQHPVLGPIYWTYCSNADCNAPDYYGLTDCLDSAMVFKSGCYGWLNFSSFKSKCLEEFSCDAEEQWDVSLEEYIYVYEYSLETVGLAIKAKCTPSEMHKWLHEAIWVEQPAPVKIYFLSDLNGFVGYAPEWTENVQDALSWSRHMLADEDDLDVVVARSLGKFIPVSQAMVISPSVRKASLV